AGNLPGAPLPSVASISDGGKLLLFNSEGFSGEQPLAQLVYQPMGDRLRLAWSVNHYTPDGSHWWNVRIDAMTGVELDRNDWVSQCAWDHAHADHDCALPEAAMAPPAAPNDFNVYGWPKESPIHGGRSLRNAPWAQGGIASPYGWQDTNGAAGAEYTITRGNNVWAKEDIANDNETTIGFSPDGGPALDFDFPINLANAPNTYQSALITNLYYWNNTLHDVLYGYGFNDPAGNFQQNNYGRGGTGNDYVLADALDGSGTNNANFATPAEGTRPRMQMFVWNLTTPNRTSDLDNGVIAHEYGHGVSNRLVGGPANVNCLTNVEQMGEGWSDYLALMMTIKAGDTGPMPRGVGTYLVGQPITGGGIRPAPYSTDFGLNAYTYGSTNNTALTVPHGMGFVWCTILWEMTWDLIGIYGLDPNIYNGTGGNNRAMRLVIEAMKLTPCNPGFVQARDAILLADQNLYGGANQTALWAAFARRGLGSGASQGTAASRTDQVESYSSPITANLGVASITEPMASFYFCPASPVTVRAVVRNYGANAQSNFPVRYRLNGGAWVSQNVPGPLAPGAAITVTFTMPLTIPSSGTHTLDVETNLASDLYAADNRRAANLVVTAGTTVTAPYSEGLSAASPTPLGWALQNPDNSFTWSTIIPPIGPGPTCASSRAWFIDNFNYNGVGQEDRLITPIVNLSLLYGSRLRFDQSYARYNASLFDGFRVDVSGNCGGNWVTLLNQAGAVLATAPDNTALFSPANCTQWRAHDLDISAYDGQSVLARFVGINGYGNRLFLDNVQFTGASALPVELLRFTATDRAQGVLVQWTTASERNSSHFEVLRSNDGNAWESIARAAARGHSEQLTDYEHVDPAPFPGTSYYRLRSIDLDGSSELSDIASVTRYASLARIHPNPSKGQFWVEHGGGALDVRDALGQQVPFLLESSSATTGRVSLIRPVPGMYFVRFSGSGPAVERIVVGD
ncbi:MAG TPA: M36 family metallopeptidase, partial [Flavobacteriales bacterium]|nr:M36 family metallopeptidase [Flavobacteriales bacterium]